MPPCSSFSSAAGGRRAQLGQQPVVEHRPERGDAERAADRAEERGRRRGRAEAGVRHRVLHRDDEDLHDEPEPEADDEHEGATNGVRRAGLQRGRAARGRRR